MLPETISVLVCVYVCVWERYVYLYRVYQSCLDYFFKSAALSLLLLHSISSCHFPFLFENNYSQVCKTLSFYSISRVKSFWHSGRWTFYNNNGAGLFWLIGNLRRENVPTLQSDKTELNGSEWWGQWLVQSVLSLSCGFTECETHTWMLAAEGKPSYER